jgi:flagellar basal body-associated protein FliL
LCADVVLDSPDKFLTAPARDIVVSTLSGMSVDDLTTAAGREEVKKVLSDKIAAMYRGVVYRVFFAEFVTQ